MTAIIQQPSIDEVIDNLFETGEWESITSNHKFRDWLKVRDYDRNWQDDHEPRTILEEYLTDMRRAARAEGYTARCAARSFAEARGLKAIGPNWGERHFKVGGKLYLVTSGEESKQWLVFPL